MIGNKPSIYNAPTVYNQGGGGATNNAGFNLFSMVITDVNEHYISSLVEFNDRFELICSQSGKKIYAGVQPNIDPIDIDDLEKLEASLHMYFVPQTRDNRADIFATAFNIMTGTEGKRWVNARYLNYSDELFLFSDLTGFASNTTLNAPDIINKEITLKLTYNKLTSRLRLEKTSGGTPWMMTVSTDNSKLAGESIGISFGIDKWEGYPFNAGTIIYKTGTYVKYNDTLVWGIE